MLGFVNKIEFIYHEFQTNGTVRDESYNVKLLFPMKDFLSFVTDLQSMFFVSTILLKYNICGLHVPQFQLAYI